MEVTTKQYTSCDVVKAVGRIDSSTAPQLQEAFDAIIAAERFGIVFDMSEVEFISSAGLRILIAVQKECQHFDRGEIVLVSVPEQVHEAMDLAGLVPLFKFFDNLVDAVGYF